MANRYVFASVLPGHSANSSDTNRKRGRKSLEEENVCGHILFGPSGMESCLAVLI